jgi:hypothetical protein
MWPASHSYCSRTSISAISSPRASFSDNSVGLMS